MLFVVFVCCCCWLCMFVVFCVCLLCFVVCVSLSFVFVGCCAPPRPHAFYCRCVARTRSSPHDTNPPKALEQSMPPLAGVAVITLNIHIGCVKSAKPIPTKCCAKCCAHKSAAKNCCAHMPTAKLCCCAHGNTPPRPQINQPHRG